jgi:hypothetical protein
VPPLPPWAHFFLSCRVAVALLLLAAAAGELLNLLLWLVGFPRGPPLRAAWRYFWAPGWPGFLLSTLAMRMLPAGVGADPIATFSLAPALFWLAGGGLRAAAGVFTGLLAQALCVAELGFSQGNANRVQVLLLVAHLIPRAGPRSPLVYFCIMLAAAAWCGAMDPRAPLERPLSGFWRGGRGRGRAKAAAAALREEVRSFPGGFGRLEAPPGCSHPEVLRVMAAEDYYQVGAGGRGVGVWMPVDQG